AACTGLHSSRLHVLAGSAAGSAAGRWLVRPHGARAARAPGTRSNVAIPAPTCTKGPVMAGGRVVVWWRATDRGLVGFASEAVLLGVVLIIVIRTRWVRAIFRGLTTPYRVASAVLLALSVAGWLAGSAPRTFPFIPWRMDASTSG